MFCINSQYKLHYRLPDESEYCVLIEPGTVVGLLGGVFEYRLEEGLSLPGAMGPGCFLTCYTSKTMFGEGGSFPMPHPEMHIHPKQDVRPQRSPSPEPILVTPRSSKRLKLAQRREEKITEPEVRLIDGQGKRFLRPATTLFYPTPPPTTNPNTAVHRCIYDLDPLTWPKFTVAHITTAYGQKTADPLKKAANKLRGVSAPRIWLTPAAARLSVRQLPAETGRKATGGPARREGVGGAACVAQCAVEAHRVHARPD